MSIILEAKEGKPITGRGAEGNGKDPSSGVSAHAFAASKENY